MRILVSYRYGESRAISGRYCNNHKTGPALCSRRWKEKMKINKSKKQGFTLVEIMIVVAIIGMLAAIAIPNFVKARNTAQANACISNMKQVDGGIQQWALEKGKKDSDAPVSAEVAEYVKGRKMPTCPSGGDYALGATVATVPSITCPNEASTPPHKLP